MARIPTYPRIAAAWQLGIPLLTLAMGAATGCGDSTSPTLDESSAGGPFPVGGGGDGGLPPATGGVTNMGGVASTGGAPNTGGLAVTGGTIAFGGTTGGAATTGGVATTGGLAATGGVTDAGGVANTAGATSTGGSPNTGGVTETGGAVATGGAAGDRETQAGVCERWRADREDMSEGTWSGDLSMCDPGDISEEGRVNALRLFNLYRWLAYLPPVETDPDLNEMAQACALLQAANSELSHEPPQTWNCWTELGAEGAATSNISGGPGVMSVDLYMLDDGNETTMGHRRIILSNWLGPIGLGSTGDDGKSCMQNIGGSGDADRAWTAFPPEGIIPVQLFDPTGWRTVDDTGWSIQSEEIDLSGASVSVTANGTPVSVEASPLTGNYGARFGLRIVPSGWSAQAGTTYQVSVTEISTPITYTVEVVDCS